MITIPAVLECCAGIDVGKRALAVAVLKGPADKEAEIQTRWFGTTVPALESLRQWLEEEGCTSVAMESTGSYWIPVKNVLEASQHIVLVCSRKHQPKKGEKTDFRDAINLGHQHRHGMLTGSYLPERGVVELRDLTRRRKKLQGNLNSEKNRIQKTLEVANVKIGNVISDIFGISGQEMLEALLSGRELPAEEIADMAKKRLRKRIPELTEALRDHHMTDHHRWLIQQSIDHIVMLDRQLEEIEDKIQEKLEPYRRQFELVLTTPGMKDVNAASILAEIGPDMRFFETADRICSWAGISPGNNRSAGKSKSSHVKKANKFLFAALVQAGWAAARKRDSIFQRKFHRWVGKLGKKRANVAIARSLLRVVYTILRDGQPYQEPDLGRIHELERQKLVHHHARRLRQLGADPDEVERIVEQLLAANETDSNSPSGDELPPPEEAEPQLDRAEVAPSEETAGRAKPSRRPAAVRRQSRAAAICRGALGFRARQMRNTYSTVKDPPGNRPSQAVPIPIGAENVKMQT
jgi:transposase